MQRYPYDGQLRTLAIREFHSWILVTGRASFTDLSETDEVCSSARTPCIYVPKEDLLGVITRAVQYL